MWCLCGAPALPARTTPLEEPPAAPPGSHAWLRAALADGRPAAFASSSANTSRLHAALLSHAGDRLAPSLGLPDDEQVIDADALRAARRRVL